MKKILCLMSVFVLVLVGCSGTETYETTYTVPATEDVVFNETVTTEINGFYTIGQSPSEYVTGNETEFTTSQSGVYVAGEDFPAGTYDLVPVSGGGNVFGPNVNAIMGTQGGDFYTNYYDNVTFEEGNELEVSGVSIKLVPQTEDTFSIPAGTYNLVAIEGGGNVQGAGLNEIMGTNGGDFYVKNYDNATFGEGETLQIQGVALEITPKEPILIQEATEAYDVTETLSIDSEGVETCTSNKEEVPCSELKEYESLKQQADEASAE